MFDTIMNNLPLLGIIGLVCLVVVPVVCCLPGMLENYRAKKARTARIAEMERQWLTFISLLQDALANAEKRYKGDVLVTPVLSAEAFYITCKDVDSRQAFERVKAAETFEKFKAKMREKGIRVELVSVGYYLHGYGPHAAPAIRLRPVAHQFAHEAIDKIINGRFCEEGNTPARRFAFEVFYGLKDQTCSRILDGNIMAELEDSVSDTAAVRQEIEEVLAEKGYEIRWIHSNVIRIVERQTAAQAA